jgi:tRNA (Thr-GGU) A37 N-methylase
MELTPIGTVASPLTDPDSAPRQGDEGAPEAWLELAAEVAPGTRLRVSNLEALDGTPVVDLKPVLGGIAER